MMIMKQHTVLAAALGCTGILWMTSANAFFCFSGGSGARTQTAPVSYHGAPAFYPPPVMLTHPGAAPAAAYDGYPHSPAPYGYYPVVPEQLRQQ